MSPHIHTVFAFIVIVYVAVVSLFSIQFANTSPEDLLLAYIHDINGTQGYCG